MPIFLENRDMPNFGCCPADHPRQSLKFGMSLFSCRRTAVTVGGHSFYCGAGHDFLIFTVSMGA
jgi:hypothetical protein